MKGNITLLEAVLSLMSSLSSVVLVALLDHQKRSGGALTEGRPTWRRNGVLFGIYGLHANWKGQ